MIKKFTTIVALVAMALNSNAQTWVKDSLVMGAGQPNDVYYHLGTGLVKIESNQNWAIALSNQGGQKAGVYTNNRAGILCYNVHKPMSAWSTLTLADTATAIKQYNQDTCWYIGALNANADGSAFDYGWGSYAGGPTHNVVGDSIYIIKQGNNFLKLRIDSLGGFTKNWTVTVNALGLPAPTADQIITVSPSPKYVNSNFIYLSVVQAPPPNFFAIVDTNREPANNTWDFVATKYTKLLITPPMAQNYTGLLTNGKVKSVQVTSVPVDVTATNYATASYTATINNIGADWKFFNGTSYEMDDTTNSYLIQSNDGAYYQIRFRQDAYAIATPLIRFEKRKVGFPTPINEVNNNATSFSIYPNPALADVMVALESKESAMANIIVSDVQGKTVFAKSINITKGLNAYTLPIAQLTTGNYVLSIKGNQISASQLFTKQ